MHKWPLLIFFTYIIFNFTACSVYTSSDRKKFETDNAILKTAPLNLQSCSKTSIRSSAHISQVYAVTNTGNSDPSIFLWKHIVGDSTVFESDDLKGVYCLYE